MIGFIGSGNMSQAIIGGILKSELYDGSQIFCSAKSDKTKEKVKNKFNVNVCDNIEVVEKSKIIFLGVKPNTYETVLEEIKDHLDDKIIISIAPLKTIEFLRSHTNQDLKCVSSMPNTPAMVGAGMSAVSFSENLTDKERGAVLGIFTSFGKVEVIDESLMQSVVAVSGSAPAYVYLLLFFSSPTLSQLSYSSSNSCSLPQIPLLIFLLSLSPSLPSLYLSLYCYKTLYFFIISLLSLLVPLPLQFSTLSSFPFFIILSLLLGIFH